MPCENLINLANIKVCIKLCWVSSISRQFLLWNPFRLIILLNTEIYMSRYSDSTYIRYTWPMSRVTGWWLSWQTGSHSRLLSQSRSPHNSSRRRGCLRVWWSPASPVTACSSPVQIQWECIYPSAAQWAVWGYSRSPPFCRHNSASGSLLVATWVYSCSSRRRIPKLSNSAGSSLSGVGLHYWAAPVVKRPLAFLDCVV